MIIQKKYITFEALGPFASVQPSSSGFDPQAVTFSILPVTLKIASAKMKKRKILQIWIQTKTMMASQLVWAESVMS